MILKIRCLKRSLVLKIYVNEGKQDFIIKFMDPDYV